MYLLGFFIIAQLFFGIKKYFWLLQNNLAIDIKVILIGIEVVNFIFLFFLDLFGFILVLNYLKKVFFNKKKSFQYKF